MSTKLGQLLFEDAEIIFSNFKGAKSKFNSEGDRNFCIVISEDRAAELTSQGINVKVWEREEEEPIYYVKVKISFAGFKDPRIFMVTNTKAIPLYQSSLGLIDDSKRLGSDIILNQSMYDVNGSTGISLYLDTIYVNVEVDQFAHKYAVAYDSSED